MTRRIWRVPGGLAFEKYPLMMADAGLGNA